MSELAELVELAQELQAFCISRNWKFCFIGGLAVQHWSEPRVTTDVDLTLLTGFGHEESYIDEWLRHYKSRRPGAREFALHNRVLLLEAKSGLGIDVALGALPFEEGAVKRARNLEIVPGVRLRFCSPEDLIVMKAFANRDFDWRDIRMTIVRQGTTGLDWRYIRKQLKPLAELKEEPEILSQLEALRKEYTRRESKEKKPSRRGKKS